MHKNVLLRGIAAGLCGFAAMNAHATLFTTDFGSLVPGYAPNDDGSFQVTLPFSVNYFGTSYNSVYINNNGNATFGSGTVAFSPSTLTTEDLQQMVAPYWTDLTSLSDPLGAIAPGTGGSGVYYNQLSPSQMVFTWDRLGYFGPDYSGRAQFQMVLNNPSSIPTGEGAIGFFYGTVTPPATDQQVAIGIGDGLPGVNPGEVNISVGSTGSIAPAVSGHSVWLGVPGTSGPGVPGQPNGGALPEPTPLALMPVGLVMLGWLRRRRAGACSRPCA